MVKYLLGIKTQLSMIKLRTMTTLSSMKTDPGLVFKEAINMGRICRLFAKLGVKRSIKFLMRIKNRQIAKFLLYDRLDDFCLL